MSDIVGQIGTISFSVDKGVAAELSRLHGINVEAEIRVAIKKEMQYLKSQAVSRVELDAAKNAGQFE